MQTEGLSDGSPSSFQKREGRNLKNEEKMLQEIRKATQMGCYGIQAVLDETADRDLAEALKEQHTEYDKLFREADRLLHERGSSGKDINFMARYGAMMSSKAKVRTSSDPTAKIAELMMDGNTRGMIKSIRNIRTMGLLEPQISNLSTRLLQTEQANIDQMKHFL